MLPCSSPASIIKMFRLLVACLAVAAIGFVQADEPERVVGGENARNGEFPYIISIRVDGSHFCGGSIVDRSYIVTAAHCLEPLKGRGYGNVYVVTGTNSIQSGGQSHRVADMFIHSGYNAHGISWYNDIGVIKLANPITFNAVQQPIALPTSPLPAGANVMLSGWGLTGAPPRGRTPTLLQKLLLRSISTADCQRYYPDMKIYDNMICTLRNVNFGSCHGDSGGPLAFGNTLAGVVSGGIPCARGMPDVFSSVFHHLNFIRQCMTY